MRITAVAGDTATIAVEGLEQQASIVLVPEARVGDYVLVHAGYAITVMQEDDAQETLALLAELEAFDDAATGGDHGPEGLEDRDGPS
jgi:hydrogenase expression/formation protein HypC